MGGLVKELLATAWILGSRDGEGRRGRVQVGELLRMLRPLYVCRMTDKELKRRLVRLLPTLPVVNEDAEAGPSVRLDTARCVEEWRSWMVECAAALDRKTKPRRCRMFEGILFAYACYKLSDSTKVSCSHDFSSYDYMKHATALRDGLRLDTGCYHCSVCRTVIGAPPRQGAGLDGTSTAVRKRTRGSAPPASPTARRRRVEVATPAGEATLAAQETTPTSTVSAAIGKPIPMPHMSDDDLLAIPPADVIFPSEDLAGLNAATGSSSTAGAMGSGWRIPSLTDDAFAPPMLQWGPTERTAFLAASSPGGSAPSDGRCGYDPPLALLDEGSASL